MRLKKDRSCAMALASSALFCNAQMVINRKHNYYINNSGNRNLDHNDDNGNGNDINDINGNDNDK